MSFRPNLFAPSPDHAVEYALELAMRLLPMPAPPSVEWRPYRTTAGRAYFDENTIRLSSILLTDGDRIHETVLHEYAHLWVHMRYGGRAKPHGTEWQHAMRVLGADPSVTHQYAVQRNRVPRRLVYACSTCGAKIRRVRPLKRNYIYVHTGCGGRIKPLGRAKAAR